MRSFIKNNCGSISPLIVFFIVIIIAGFLCGVLGLILDPLTTDTTAMDRIMSAAWPTTILFIFLFSISWLLMNAQKSKGGFNY